MQIQDKTADLHKTRIAELAHQLKDHVRIAEMPEAHAPHSAPVVAETKGLRATRLLESLQIEVTVKNLCKF